jgi:transporter family protein
VALNVPLWVALTIGSALFAALSTLFGKVGVSTVSTTATTVVRAGIMFATIAAAAVLTGRLSEATSLTGKPLLMVVLSGVAGALSWLCFFAALKVGKAGTVSSLDRLSVVFVVVLAAVFLGEKITLKIALGSALVAIGAVLVAF